MLQQFLNHIARFQLSQSESKTLLAVSGGVDSMVMLALYRAAGINVAVAHCNFQLRGSDSDEDEHFVREKCIELDVAFFSTRFDTIAYQEQYKLSTQVAARELRYAWFEQLRATHNFDYIATAHHLNDSMETTLLNWIHGGGTESMNGIRVRNEHIVRPLLFASREDIERYASSHGVSWREDKSNASDDYQRNFVRHQIIPKLHEINPSLEQSILKGIEKSFAEAEFAAVGSDYLQQRMVEFSEGKMRIQKDLLAGLKHPAAILWRWVRHLGFNLDSCQQVIVAMKGQAGKRFLSSQAQMVIDRDQIIIAPLEQHWPEIKIESAERHVQLGMYSMDISFLEAVYRSDNRLEATLDAAKVNFPLQWRRWKAGDSFFPLGMLHRKKVSDLLIDLKISRSDKDSVTVLESNGEIIWVVGHRIDDRYKITAHTQSIVSFHVRPHFT